MSVEQTRGAALVTLILWLPVLVAGTALALDVGQVMLLRVRLQAAADLAALAAVGSVDWDALAEGTVRLHGQEAEDFAHSYAQDNLELIGDVEVDRVKVWVVNAAPDEPQVHPVTGEELHYPTVVVRCDVQSPTGWFIILPQGLLRVEADASIRPRTDY